MKIDKKEFNDYVKKLMNDGMSPVKIVDEVRIKFPSLHPSLLKTFESCLIKQMK